MKEKLKRSKVNKRSKSIYYRVFKRVADIFCSLMCLVVLIIVLPFIAVAIKIDSPGPVFFTQLRVGRYGNLFKIIKLRTMELDAEKNIDRRVFKNKKKPFVQQKNDPRVTRVGKFLRRSSLDELPQLFCVLRGTMSFIGPRPFIPQEVKLLKEEHLKRLTVKPGMTGLAQVNGRGSLALEERMEKDLEYIRNMSAWLDIKILFFTVFSVFNRKGVN